MSLFLGLYRRVQHLLHELMKFGIVGSVAFLVDVGTFNVLLYAGGAGPLHDRPLIAKTVSVVLGTTVAFVGNRHWTFRHRDRSRLRRDYPLFFMFNGVGLVIALTCLAFSRYVLGLSGPVADNIAANVVGMGLGSAFRFWSYRRWVFPALMPELAAPGANVDVTRSPGEPTSDTAEDRDVTPAR